MIEKVSFIALALLAFIACLAIGEIASRCVDRLLKRRWRVRRERRVVSAIRTYDSEKELVKRASNVFFLRKQAG